MRAAELLMKAYSLAFKFQAAHTALAVTESRPASPLQYSRFTTLLIYFSFLSSNFSTSGAKALDTQSYQLWLTHEKERGQFVKGLGYLFAFLLWDRKAVGKHWSKRKLLSFPGSLSYIKTRSLNLWRRIKDWGGVSKTVLYCQRKVWNWGVCTGF